MGEIRIESGVALGGGTQPSKANSTRDAQPPLHSAVALARCEAGIQNVLGPAGDGEHQDNGERPREDNDGSVEAIGIVATGFVEVVLKGARFAGDSADVVLKVPGRLANVRLRLPNPAWLIPPLLVIAALMAIGRFSTGLRLLRMTSRAGPALLLVGRARARAGSPRPPRAPRRSCRGCKTTRQSDVLIVQAPSFGGIMRKAFMREVGCATISTLAAVTNRPERFSMVLRVV